MARLTNIDDIIGIRSVTPGFFKEMQKTIRELQASNSALEQKRQDVQAIFDAIPDAMAVLSLDFALLSVNSAFYDRYGVKEFCGKPCYQIFFGRQAPCSPCSLLMTLEGSCNVCRHLHVAVLQGGNRQLECTASLMLDAQGKASRAVLLLRDVTLENEYQTKYFQAEKLATIGMLAEGVAHEINNPLASVSGFTEALTLRLEKLGRCLRRSEECDELLDSFEDYLETILMECNRCSGIVQNLLTFGHRDISSRSNVNLNNIVHNCLKLLSPRLALLPADIIKHSLSEGEPCVLGHPGELMQVVLNLVSNALYAVKDSGKILVSTAMMGEFSVLKVEDSGEGISQENLNRVFEPFFTTKPPGKGIGIGLSSCYNIIGKHGGEILVESSLGQGSVFTIILPALIE